MRTAQHEQARYTWRTPRQIADELGYTIDHIHDLIRAGKLRAHNFGSGARPDYRIHPDAWDAFLRATEVVPE